MANEKGVTIVASNASDKLQSAVERVKSFWSSSQRNVVIITIFSMISAAIIVVMLWASAEEYRPLYSTSSNYDSSQVLQLLDQSGLKYELNSDSGQIMVPSNEVAKTRMILAAKGLKQQLPSGFDTLASTDSLGESQFMETARYRHALEGELARSIVTMESIAVARVHLAIPKASLFKRKDQEQARASVMVQLIEGMDLKPGQVDSIVNLVSGAVIGLKAENVRVVDQYGRLLSKDTSLDDLAVSTNRQTDYRRNIEKHLVSQASDMLTPILGSSNFRVQVSAKVDFSKRQETEETYGTPVVRAETLMSDENNGSLALGIPGALSNTPPVTDQDTQNQEEQTNKAKASRNESKREYAVSGKVTHVQHQQGIVEKLTISVIVNESMAGEAGWSDATLERMQNVVRSAVGYEEDRGDVIYVTSFPFVASNMPDAEQMAWYKDQDILQPIKYLLGALVAALLIVLVLRPLAQYLTKTDGSDLEELTEGLEVGSTGEMAALSTNSATAAAGLENKLDSLALDAAGIKAMDDNLPESDSPLEVQIQHLKMIAQNDPKRVTEILRTWMHA
ncbi:flagellar basal-body MS-ring/collar protein FliF [Vibrio diazotrophicus]|jgi:flagellar M-ring protein FliF|uniref:flagellar basal-body MS-ring/collar protein FliF n=1 Tax=Vibrio diazotrophicus TaxID=685 RepID=UPI0022AEDDC5|nr:flagellar basal-body MS-ring/collar protein FliF [Vibrio diazotrophicus]MCZ4372024.1 flagellar basal-body MS-ring/collar protein FliF [Vibrio diazotrophicus]